MAAPDYLTTAEVADYLRLKERKVYELVRERAIPCARVTGKLLFPRRAIDAWIAGAVELHRRCWLAATIPCWTGRCGPRAVVLLCWPRAAATAWGGWPPGRR